MVDFVVKYFSFYLIAITAEKKRGHKLNYRKEDGKKPPYLSALQNWCIEYKKKKKKS